MSVQNKAFENWFNGRWTDYSLRSEWFYSDCKIFDKETREEAMHAWLHAAFVAGHEAKREPDATS